MGNARKDKAYFNINNKLEINKLLFPMQLVSIYL
jgi:hypothetical protein